MADPVKLQIANAALDVLKNISRSGSTPYYTDLGRRVARGYLALAEMNSTDFPRLAVYYAAGDDAGGCIGGQYEDVDELIVEASVRSAKAQDADDELMRAEADIFRAMLTDPQLANTALEVRRARWESERNTRTDDHRGRIYVRFTVRSTRSPSAP